jgi:hypothetical protein
LWARDANRRQFDSLELGSVLTRHEEFGSRHWAAHQGHGLARPKQDWANGYGVGIVDDEPAWREALHYVRELSLGAISVLACTREPVEHPRAIGIRL